MFILSVKIQSHVLPINYCVPRGSILGHILLLFYENYLHIFCIHCKLNLLFDDTTLLFDNKINMY